VRSCVLCAKAFPMRRKVQRSIFFTTLVTLFGLIRRRQGKNHHRKKAPLSFLSFCLGFEIESECGKYAATRPWSYENPPRHRRSGHLQGTPGMLESTHVHDP
jgi:hypothetical protein